MARPIRGSITRRRRRRRPERLRFSGKLEAGQPRHVGAKATGVICTEPDQLICLVVCPDCVQYYRRIDLSDPKTWTDGLRVLTDAPRIVGACRGRPSGIVSWLRGLLAASALDGLKAQIGAMEQRFQLAQEKESVQAQKVDELQDVTKASQRQIEANAPRQEMTATTAAMQALSIDWHGPTQRSQQCCINLTPLHRRLTQKLLLTRARDNCTTGPERAANDVRPAHGGNAENAQNSDEYNVVQRLVVLRKPVMPVEGRDLSSRLCLPSREQDPRRVADAGAGSGTGAAEGRPDRQEECVPAHSRAAGLDAGPWR